MAAYEAAFEQLRAADQTFPCWCSRSELASVGGIHRDGRCVAPPRTDLPPAWRLRVPDTGVGFNDALQGPQRQNLREAVGDFVLLRADGLWAYQLACVVDDAAQGVTEVVRGCDLLDSTPRQIHLQRLLDLPTPRYRHISLAVDGEGRKLSKSDGDAAVGTADPLPALRAALAFLGLPPAARDGDDAPTVLVNAVAAFDPQNIAPTGCGTRRSTDAFLA
jgi:glutamyl-Q tRNA(Asp) synthetase